MTRTSAVPQIHQVFNEFDDHGVLMGLSRLEGEDNQTYKRRLLDVMVHRANSSYLGLIYGITRELGLELKKVLRVTMDLDAEGNPILPLPAISFDETKCILYSDYSAGTIVQEFDRWEVENEIFTLTALVDAINSVDYFNASLLPGVDGDARSMTLFNQSSIESVIAEDIAVGGPRIQLQNRNLIEGTVTISASNLSRQVATEEGIVSEEDYFIDLQNGIIFAATAPSPGATIRYKYAGYDTTFMSSPVILHNLQSADFQTKLFQSTVNNENGLPTALGADIINELLSVFPTTWGR